jgi:hypothetical protein
VLETQARVEGRSVVGRHGRVEGGETVARLGRGIDVDFVEPAPRIKRGAGQGQGVDPVVRTRVEGLALLVATVVSNAARLRRVLGVAFVFTSMKSPPA